jgi:hypothetical protein
VHRFRLPPGYYANWCYVGGAVVGTVVAAVLGAGPFEAFFPYGFLTAITAELISRALWWFNHRKVSEP